MKQFGILYIVATPIGNLQDITVRAIKVLNEVDVIACEDTRRTRILLESIGPIYHTLFADKPERSARLLSYHEHNEETQTVELMLLLKNGLNIALVSDAGMPLVSDPGFKLVRECIQEGIEVTTIPGATSVVSALALSGLPVDQFLFLGYLPRKSSKREKVLHNLSESFKQNSYFHPTIILFEAPHRLVETLSDIARSIGNIEAVLVRELTKIHEEVLRASLQSLIETYSSKSPKGEFTILFNLKEN